MLLQLFFLEWTAQLFTFFPTSIVLHFVFSGFRIAGAPMAESSDLNSSHLSITSRIRRIWYIYSISIGIEFGKCWDHQNWYNFVPQLPMWQVVIGEGVSSHGLQTLLRRSQLATWWVVVQSCAIFDSPSTTHWIQPNRSLRI